jgi:hypothetical protein
MKRNYLIIALILLSSFINIRGQNIGEIPVAVKQKADSIILSILDTFYYKLTTFNCQESLIHVKNPDHLILNNCNKIEQNVIHNEKSDFYVLVFELALKPNSIYKFEVRIDSNLKQMRDIKLPRCKTSNACKINIDNLSAKNIAFNSGLKEGLGIYNEGLIFDEHSQSFQWRIKNLEQHTPMKGELIYIDAVSGKRIYEKDRAWSSPIYN